MNINRTAARQISDFADRILIRIGNLGNQGEFFYRSRLDTSKLNFYKRTSWYEPNELVGILTYYSRNMYEFITADEDTHTLIHCLNFKERELTVLLASQLYTNGPHLYD